MLIAVMPTKTKDPSVRFLLVEGMVELQGP